MKKFRWQLIIIFLTGIVVGVLLLLERGGGSLTPGEAHPVAGGVYTEAVVGQLQRLNPLLDKANPADRDLDKLIFSGLVKFDSQGYPEPDLAESWVISQDGLIYTVTLKDGLKWHDGQELTAGDVAFTTEMMVSGGSYVADDLKAFWEAIKVVVLDDTHIQFVLPEAFAPFLDYLSFGVLPEHLLGDKSIDEMANDTFNLAPVGSGPYMFSSMEVENNQITGVTLKSFADYAGGSPYIREFIIRYYPDSASALQAYKDGFVQGISKITSDVLPQALAESNLAIYSGRLPEMSMILFNLNDESVDFFQNVNIRKAFYMAINRDQMISQFFNGQAIKTDGVIFPDTWAYLSNMPSVSYDPDQAALLLKEEGYVLTGEENPVRMKDEQELKFVLSYPDDELHRKLAEYIQKSWQELGATITLEAVPTDLFVSDTLSAKAYQAALVDINLSSTPDPDPYPFWDQGEMTGGQNYSQWNNRVASDILEQARITIDLTERTRLYHNFQAIFAQELPALPLYFPVYNYGVDKQVQGVTIGPLIDTSYRYETVASWYLVAKRTSEETTVPQGK